MQLTEAAALEQKKYMQAYRKANRDRINLTKKEWLKCQKNKDRQKIYIQRYWTKKALESIESNDEFIDTIKKKKSPI